MHRRLHLLGELKKLSRFRCGAQAVVAAVEELEPQLGFQGLKLAADGRVAHPESVRRLAQRGGAHENPFETLTIDVSSVASAKAAVAELERRGQPMAAKRYVDVLLDDRGRFTPGKTYTSRPKKMVGPLVEVEYPHVNDEARQEVAWGVLGQLTGTTGRREPERAPA